MKIAVITGASSGLGREFVMRLGAISMAEKTNEIDCIWAIARGADRLKALGSSCGIPVRAIPADLTDREKIAEYASLLEKEKPDVRWLINCAGYGKFCRYDSIDISESLNMIDLNCSALVNMTLSTLPYMSSGAHIIQLASAAAFQPLPFANIYAASKAFVLSYSRGLAPELKERGISVTAVCPYWVNTAFFDRANSIGNSASESAVKHYEIMAEPGAVVEKALRDVAKGKDKSSYGVYNRLQQLGAKLAPFPVTLAAWKKKQKLEF